ncbi:hypothetical protein PC128_g2090 [Phytophthora cactorum]|nr:hypothetical protein PC128_g2090 [Phytophthora cactorum]
MHDKLGEKIYMWLPGGLRELLTWVAAEGNDACMLVLQSLYGRLTCLDKHLKDMRFKAADTDPCVYTRGGGDDECIVSLYVNDKLIAVKDKAIIISVAAGAAQKLKIKDLGRARFILVIKIDYDMERRTLHISQYAYTESVIKKFGQQNVSPCLAPLEAGVHLTKADKPQTEEDKVMMSSKRYRFALMYMACGGPTRRLNCRRSVKNVDITYDGRQGTEIIAYSDADWAVWCSTSHMTITLSSTETEYMAHK